MSAVVSEVALDHRDWIVGFRSRAHQLHNSVRQLMGRDCSGIYQRT
jgi:hypothetical protein